MSDSLAWFRIILTGFFLLAEPGYRLHATPWELSKDLRESTDTSEIRERFPSINNPGELSGLLLDLSRLNPFFSLEAKLYNNTWVIFGEKAEFVTEIKIDLITRRLEQAMEEIRQKYLGHVDSLSVRRRVTDKILNILSDYGYLLAEVNFRLESTPAGKSYHIEVDEGEPCIISKIHFPFTLPKKAAFSIKPGDLCDVDQLSHAIDSLEDTLLNMGYRDLRISLDTISYSRDGREAEIFVKGFMGKRITYEIVDKSRLFLIDDIFEGSVNDSDVQLASPDAMKAELVKFYRIRGYEDVSISPPKIQQVGENEEKYTFTIVPGKQYLVTHIEFEGNHQYSSSELKEIMNVTSFWDNSVILNRDEFIQGTDAIKALYQKNGFWKAKIHEPRITKDQSNGTAQMIILVNEGKKHVLDTLEYLGNSHIESEKLQELFQVQKGEHLDKSALLELQDTIRALYMAEGFQYVEINISAIAGTGQRTIPTKVLIRISEGTRVKVGKVQITGLIRTKTEVVKRELQFKTGDWYNPELISQSRSSLMNLGFFRSVQIVPTDRVAFLDKSPVLDVTIEAFEGNAGSVSFGPGYTLRKGLHYSSEFTYQNLWGTGRQMSLKASFSEERDQDAISNAGETKGKLFLGRKFAAGYVEPYLFGFPVDGHIALSHRGLADEIWHLSNVFDLSLSYKSRDFIPGSEWKPFYNFKFNKEEGSKTQDQNLVSTGNSRIASVGLRFTRDRRNDLGWPESGDLMHWELSWARPGIGGEFSFFKWAASYRHFLSLHSNVVWTSGISLAAFEGVERKNSDLGLLPYSERLQAGGVSTVRGFERKLGPYVSSADEGFSPTGGSRRTLLSSEIRYKISDLYAASFFIDSGNTFFSQGEENRIATIFSGQTDSERSLNDNMVYSPSRLFTNPAGTIRNKHYNAAGFSLSWITPIGPLNLYFSWPVSEPGDITCGGEGKGCFIRRRETDPWFRKYQFDINIGAEF